MKTTEKRDCVKRRKIISRKRNDVMLFNKNCEGHEVNLVTSVSRDKVLFSKLDLSLK